MSQDENQLKAAAAESAVAQVSDGMILGLGSGSTAEFAIRAIGKRVKSGLRVVGIPTSERTAALARELGIPLTTLEQQPQPDLTIDGADEVEEGNLNLIKGRGGALLREKIVASASKKLAIIVHSSKVVGRLGIHDPVPVEVISFGWQVTARHLADLGAKPVLRQSPAGGPYHSDSGNFIIDCGFQSIASAGDLARELDHVVGLVEHGLFIGLTSEVHVASESGVKVLRK
ncbi:MAG TPA: ribose-5-phosphate isomerase RpiA [Bryobacteraceae bacterium]|nr:ribose-5-phosphate isomerase RpiA [Bryobacteraceae bacterium]